MNIVLALLFGLWFGFAFGFTLRNFKDKSSGKFKGSKLDFCIHTVSLIIWPISALVGWLLFKYQQRKK